MIYAIRNLIPFGIKILKLNNKNNKVKKDNKIIGKILKLIVNTKTGNVDAICKIYKKYEKEILNVKK
jgi:hypothetical protein